MFNHDHHRKGPTVENLVGRRFGHLAVVSIVPERTPNRGAIWLCECDCGTRVTRLAVSLKRQRNHKIPKYCGRRDCPYFPTHGLTGSRPMRIWSSMKSRCQYVKHPHFSRYGGRGIKVCDAWANSFTAFWSDMGTSYQPGLTIDRIDNNGNYEPGNCRWATVKEQGNNARHNVIVVTPSGSLTLMQTSERYGVEYHKLRMRLQRGWPVERALNLESTAQQKGA